MKKRMWKTLSVRRALLLLFGLGVLLPLLLFAFLYTNQLNSYLGTIEREDAQIVVSNNAEQLRSIVERISYTSAYLCNSKDMVTQVQRINSEGNTNAGYRARDLVSSMLRDLSNSTLYRLEPYLAVLTRSGYLVEHSYSTRTVDPEPYFDEAYYREHRVKWFNVLDEDSASDLASTWPIYDVKKQLIGYLIISIPQSSLWSNLSNHPLLRYRQEIYAYDTRISSNEEQPFSERETYSVFENKIDNWGLRLVVTVPTRVFESRARSQVRLYGLYFAVLIAVLLFVISGIAHFVSRPIRLTNAKLKRIAAGDYAVSPVPNGFAETTELSENLNEVAQQIASLIGRVAEEARLKEKMRHDALLAQINPHFLYNSLSSIRLLIQLGGSERAVDMLTRLGNILHYSFGSESDCILLCDELRFLNDYMEMMQVRYGNNIGYHVSVPESCLGYHIPRFCLQPLVENAITHGVFSMTDGEIRLAAETEGALFLLTVSDNGVGMTQQQADALLLQEREPRAGGKSIGLRNVHRRLQLLYGAAYGLRIETGPARGLSVTVRVPLAAVTGGEDHD